jgi:hypothetical protein
MEKEVAVLRPLRRLVSARSMDLDRSGSQRSRTMVGSLTGIEFPDFDISKGGFLAASSCQVVHAVNGCVILNEYMSSEAPGKSRVRRTMAWIMSRPSFLSQNATLRKPSANSYHGLSLQGSGPQAPMQF